MSCKQHPFKTTNSMSGSNKKRVSCFTKSHHHDIKFGEEREAGLTKRVARIVRDSEEKFKNGGLPWKCHETSLTSGNDKMEL